MSACALLCLVGNVEAIDAVSLTAGRAPGVSSLRGALIWAPPHGEFLPHWLDWTGADPRFELGVSVWHGRAGGDAQGTLLGVGAAPVAGVGAQLSPGGNRRTGDLAGAPCRVRGCGFPGPGSRQRR